MKRKIIIENLFSIGVLVFILSLLAENLFTVDTDITGFCKGLGGGIALGGLVILVVKKRKKTINSRTEKKSSI